MRRPPGLDYGDGLSGDRGPARMAVRRAAMPLFVGQGYPATTIDEIAAAAGIARRSFFRLFAGKHEIVSCDHAVFHAEVADHLQGHRSERTIERAASALALVLDSFTVVPEESRQRYALCTSEPALRAEELSWVSRYQRTIAAFLSGGADATVPMLAEVQAAALVAAHNKSLRAWLRDASAPAPAAEFAAASRAIAVAAAGSGTSRRVTVIDTPLTVEEIRERLAD